jgi:hypothetical protein
MKKPKLIFHRDGRMTIDENDDDLFERISTAHEIAAGTNPDMRTYIGEGVRGAYVNPDRPAAIARRTTDI